MIRIALIGAGVMGSLHGRNFGTFSDRAQVTCVFDTDADRASALAEELGARPVATLESAIASPDVDAAAIAIPPRSHRHVVEMALSQGKHVFLEKPIALTLEDAKSIVDMGASSQAQVMVGHVLRFWPGYPELRELVLSDKYGKPVSVTCLRVQPPPSTSGWLADVHSTGGIAPLILIHDFDLMNWILGSPNSVQAFRLEGDGVAASHVVVGVSYDGANGIVEGSVSMPASYPFSTRLNVYCEDASFHFGYEVETNVGGVRDARQFTPVTEPVITIYPDDGSPKTTIDVSNLDPWRPELEYFVDRIERGLPIEDGTPEQALHALQVALAANASMIKNERVDLRPS